MPTLKSHVDIAAPRELVWSVLTDFDSYAEWHPSFVAVALYGPLLENTKATLSMQMRPGSAPAKLEVTLCEVEPGSALSWRGGMGPQWLATGFHFHNLEPLPQGATRLVHGEKFGGLMPTLLWPLFKRHFGEQYQQFNSALRQRCEALHGQS